MSKKNILLNNDGLYYDYREECEESIDFFTGSKIEVSDKKNKEKDDKKEKLEGTEDLAGLEGLVSNFGNAISNIINPPMKKLNEIDKSIFILFKNKLHRLETKIDYTTKKLRSKGVKEKPIKLNQVVKKLGAPNKVTSNPNWILNAIYESLEFYLLTIKAQSLLRTFVNEKPESSEEYLALQFNILEKVGRLITNSSPNKGVYITRPLPGNKTFNLRISSSASSNDMLAYFSDLKNPATPAAETCIPTNKLIIDSAKCLKEYHKAIKSNQRYSLTLGIEIEQRFKKAKNENSLNPYTIRYYLWLSGLNKRLATNSLHYVISTTEALDDFINQGIK